MGSNTLFHLFRLFPKELRDMLWTFAIRIDPRVIPVARPGVLHHPDSSVLDQPDSFNGHYLPPAHLQRISIVCKEVYTIFEEHMRKCREGLEKKKESHHTWLTDFDPENTVVCINDAFYDDMPFFIRSSQSSQNASERLQ
jgi:hypothetical protein